uniref:hypothetical protein n=1 Tax=Fulvivirga sp. TaxID=1931237 RepID=UPI00404A8470
MASAFDIKILWTVFKDVGTHLSGQASNKREDTAKAHNEINKAFIKTYDYLRNNQGDYVPKTDLAEVWNDASSAVMNINYELGNMLYNKSRFWLDPDLYFNLNRQSEIIELNQIVDEMERLRMKLK